MANSTGVEIPSAPAILGGSGLLPFIAFALLALFAHSPERRELALKFFVLYSGVILSFLGGVRWGAALPLPSLRLLSMSVAPSLIAFGCLLLPPKTAVGFLGITFFVVGLIDSTRGAHALWPEWFKRLRLRLSVGVVFLHLLVYFGAEVPGTLI